VSRTSNRTSSWIGLAVGVLLLGLLAAFAIGLPKAEGDDGATATIDLALPDSLPGGFVAADDPKSFQGGQYADQADDIAKQEKANSDYGNKVLPQVLGTSAATRTYVVDGSKAVFVQVFQSEGGAFAPNSIPDPSQAGGAPATQMKGVGDGVCILTYGQGATGSDPSQPVFTQCQVTHDQLTAQMGASSVSADDLVKAADSLLDGLQDQ
jgi:hypothetical protein